MKLLFNGIFTWFYPNIQVKFVQYLISLKMSLTKPQFQVILNSRTTQLWSTKNDDHRELSDNVSHDVVANRQHQVIQYHSTFGIKTPLDDTLTLKIFPLDSHNIWDTCSRTGTTRIICRWFPQKVFRCTPLNTLIYNPFGLGMFFFFFLFMSC